MPLAGITFFAQKKCYLSEQRRHFSGQNGVFVGADSVYVGGGPWSLFTLWLEVPIKDRHYNPIRSLVANGRVDEEHESLGSDDSVFIFSSWFAAKTGNITGYRCCPGGRKELLVVQLVLQQQQQCWSTVRNSGFQSVQGVAQYQVPSTRGYPEPNTRC